MTGIILFASLAVLLVIGVPISVSLGASTLFTILISPEISISTATVAQRIFAGMESTSIMAIAFFVLAGNIMTKGGISRRLVDFANSIIGGVRGGMSLAMVLACAFFAALSGSAPATVLAIGAMLYDDMIRIGYPKDRTAGLLVVSGGLGPIIPPSIIMVVYGTITGASITNMFTSGLFIGVLIALVLMIVVVIYAKKEQWPKTEKKMSFKELAVSLLKAIPALILPIIILGGIYSGVLTATEASAAAVVWSLIAGMFIYREVSIKDIPGILLGSAKSASIILFIIGTSTSFSWLFTFSGISKQLVSFVVSMNLNPTMFCFVIAILLLIFGTFLEGIAIAVLLVPVLWPIANSLGIDIIHFGMIVCVSNVIGTMTPPVAVNIFAAASVSKRSIGQIAKGQTPFFVGYVVVFLLVVFFPVLSRILL
ncbi:MAG: TRAP transporter large permease [Spirochaetaceae bacterium]|jgi:C4-dicarboxylate transporter DctM subunit|nr:TRAP transporter large permease [Spirochaetaceae bacterium]